MEEKIELILENMYPENNSQKDTDQQKKVRLQTKQPINTAEEKEFTQDEVRHIVEGFKDKTAPELNGITNQNVEIVFQAIP